MTNPSLLYGEIVMPTDVVVEHPSFGRGKITEISYDTGSPLVSVLWDSDKCGCYWVDELEFLVVRQ